ncbi:MAG TPA: universal stress protein, partial [Kofleriaceae bacterium]|nr:universal stress protein [Kofleriaceae bacterium]
ICETAATWPAELIVMGAHGESGSVRFLFGSTTTKIGRIAPCPVLVTRPGHERIAAAGALRRALVAVDYSRFSAPAAELAARMLAPGGRLALMHVWQSPGNLPMPFTGERRTTAAARLEQFADELDLSGVDVEVRIDVGNPAVQLLAQAERMDADLIVVGAHGRAGLVEQVIGTVADRVLRHAAAPVLLVPERAVQPAREDRALH